MLALSALVLGFGAAVGLRILIGGPEVSQSIPAGLAFAICLGLLAVAARPKIDRSNKTFLYGLAGGVFLCLPALVIRLAGRSPAPPAGTYALWALVVAVVALAEEAFLRGALYEAVGRLTNQTVAVLVSAVAFALLHVPLYGWHAVPLDFAVGLFLGSLRLVTGSFVAPGIAHVTADLISWWLR